MTKNFRETLNLELENKEFRDEWDALEPEYQIIKALLTARDEKDITQKQLSELTGITQSDISKIENGNANPSIKTLKRIASALDQQLVVSFEPIRTK